MFWGLSPGSLGKAINFKLYYFFFCYLTWPFTLSRILTYLVQSLPGRLLYILILLFSGHSLEVFLFIFIHVITVSVKRANCIWFTLLLQHIPVWKHALKFFKFQKRLLSQAHSGFWILNLITFGHWILFHHWSIMKCFRGDSRDIPG